LLILLVLFSSLIYCTEHEAQPVIFASIPDAMWWAVSTLTTIGYGDVHPVTTGGKFVASIIAVLGIALFALPAGILASGFIEEFQREKKAVCPHCGRELD
jgi:voltage-gated potassium channel